MELFQHGQLGLDVLRKGPPNLQVEQKSVQSRPSCFYHTNGWVVFRRRLEMPRRLSRRLHRIPILARTDGNSENRGDPSNEIRFWIDESTEEHDNCAHSLGEQNQGSSAFTEWFCKKSQGKLLIMT